MHCFSSQSGGCGFPTLQMRRLRLREGKPLEESHSASYGEYSWACSFLFLFFPLCGFALLSAAVHAVPPTAETTAGDFPAGPAAE